MQYPVATPDALVCSTTKEGYTGGRTGNMSGQMEINHHGIIAKGQDRQQTRGIVTKDTTCKIQDPIPLHREV